MSQERSIEQVAVRLKGATLHCWTAGSGHDLVLLHGGLVDSEMWDPQFGVLADHYRVIRYDRRGFGASRGSSDRFSHAGDLRDLLGYLGADSAYFVGLSGGAALAIDFTLQYPHVVDALVLASPGLGGYVWSDRLQPYNEQIGAALALGDLNGALEVTLRQWVDGPTRRPNEVNDDIRGRVKAMTARTAPRAEDQQDTDSLDPPAINRLDEISCPTLIILGAIDMPDIATIADVLEVGIPRASKVVIPGTAHYPNLERPEEFNRLVLDFLAKQS